MLTKKTPRELLEDRKNNFKRFIRFCFRMVGLCSLILFSNHLNGQDEFYYSGLIICVVFWLMTWFLNWGVHRYVFLKENENVIDNEIKTGFDRILKHRRNYNQ